MPKYLFFLFVLCWAWVLQANVTEEPSSEIGLYTSTIPPRVIMGVAYIPELSELPLEDWAYVRENLDGMWLNGAGTGMADVLQLAENIDSKNYFFIGPVNKAEYGKEGKLLELEFGLRFFNELEEIAEQPSLVLVNDYITKKGIDPVRYYSDGFVEKAGEFIEKEIAAGENPFGGRLYITTRNGHFERSVYNKTYDPDKTGKIVGRGFSTMLTVSQDGGIVYEADPFGLLDHHQEKYIQAFNRSRELGADFLWLCPRGHEGTPEEYSTALVNAYKWLNDNRLFPDGIIIIHYSRTAAAGKIEYLDMLPMINVNDPSQPAPGSFTGALYWTIKQRESALSVHGSNHSP